MVYLKYIMDFDLWSKEDDKEHEILKFNHIYMGNMFTEAAMDFDVF